jgi:holo-ACP synthase CitX
VITLQELLESRDRRAARQGELLEQFPGRVLMCLTVQLPGPEKRNTLSLKIADAGVKAVRESFSPAFEELKDLETGFEGYFIVEGKPLDVKKAAATIEDTHPLGRLFDLDVVCRSEATSCHSERSEGIYPIGRSSIGLPERRCLLCDKPARYCMRAKSHTTEELLTKIKELVDNS